MEGGHPVTEDCTALPRTQHVEVVDTVGTGEQAGDHRHRLLTRIGTPGYAAQVDVLIQEFTKAEPLDQDGGQQKPGIGNQALVIERDIEVAETVRRCHLEGAPCGETLAGSNTAIFSYQVRHFLYFHRPPQ